MQFVAKDFVLSFAVAKDPCAGMVERLKYLSELKEIFRIGFERLSNKFDSRMQNLLLDQYAKIDTSAFINTGCPDIDTAFSVLKYRIREIKETTSKKPKPTVKTDVEEIETLVKDYILEMNYSFNNGDKERFNELVKKTDALLKNLTKSDKNKIKDPFVYVDFLNFEVLLIGEAGVGRYYIPNGGIDIFELLAMSGDLRPDAIRDDIRVIRTENGTRRAYIISPIIIDTSPSRR